jgi:flagellar biosynthesis chaperone FliJ
MTTLDEVLKFLGIIPVIPIEYDEKREIEDECPSFDREAESRMEQVLDLIGDLNESQATSFKNLNREVESWKPTIDILIGSINAVQAATEKQAFENGVLRKDLKDLTDSIAKLHANEERQSSEINALKQMVESLTHSVREPQVAPERREGSQDEYRRVGGTDGGVWDWSMHGVLPIANALTYVHGLRSGGCVPWGHELPPVISRNFRFHPTGIHDSGGMKEDGGLLVVFLYPQSSFDLITLVAKLDESPESFISDSAYELFRKHTEPGLVPLVTCSDFTIVIALPDHRHIQALTTIELLSALIRTIISRGYVFQCSMSPEAARLSLLGVMPAVLR